MKTSTSHETSTERLKTEDSQTAASGVHRTFCALRALASAPPQGIRLSQLAAQIELTNATVHRLLQSLIKEGIVEQDAGTKHYRLGLDFFTMAAQAGLHMNLRDICRPSLLRLCASLGDTVFLLVRSGFDAVCVDRVDGPFPIRAFTGDIGGRVALGVGQGAMTILAFLPEAEQDEVIRYNLPRVREIGAYDEVYLRTEIEQVRRKGYTSRSNGQLEGMAGLGVPILDQRGHAVAALSIGTLTARLSEDRLPTIVDMLKREANLIGPRINPFDITLRRPMHAMSSQYAAASNLK